jgi:ferric-dicitrate binding protein FerR (iron transport regulator)
VQNLEPLNTIPLQQFLNAVKAAETSRAREVKLDIATAKNLAFTLGVVMSRLHGDLELLVAQSKTNDDEVIQINLDGGSKF